MQLFYSNDLFFVFIIGIRAVFVISSIGKNHDCLNCKDAGDPVCTHTMYWIYRARTVRERKKTRIDAHGYTEDF